MSAKSIISIIIAISFLCQDISRANTLTSCYNDTLQPNSVFDTYIRSGDKKTVQEIMKMYRGLEIKGLITKEDRERIKKTLTIVANPRVSQMVGDIFGVKTSGIQDKTRDGYISQGTECEAEFKSKLPEIEQNDITDKYRERLKQLLKRLRYTDIQGSLIGRLNDPKFRIYGFKSIIIHNRDFFLGSYNRDENKLYLAEDLIEYLESLERPSLVDEYLLHELICPVFYHYTAIEIQQEIFKDENYPDKEALGKQKTGNLYKGLLGTALRFWICQNTKMPCSHTEEFMRFIADTMIRTERREEAVRERYINTFYGLYNLLTDPNELPVYEYIGAIEDEYVLMGEALGIEYEDFILNQLAEFISVCMLDKRVTPNGCMALAGSMYGLDERHFTERHIIAFGEYLTRRDIPRTRQILYTATTIIGAIGSKRPDLVDTIKAVIKKIRNSSIEDKEEIINAIVNELYAETGGPDNIGKDIEFVIKGDKISINKNGVVLADERAVSSAESINTERIKETAQGLNIFKDFGEDFIDYIDSVKIKTFTGTSGSRAEGAFAHARDGIVYIDEMLIDNDMAVIHEMIHLFLIIRFNDDILALRGLIDNNIKGKKLNFDETRQVDPAYLRHYYARYYLQNPSGGEYQGSENEELTDKIRKSVESTYEAIINELAGLFGITGDEKIAEFRRVMDNLGDSAKTFNLQIALLKFMKEGDGKITEDEVKLLIRYITPVRRAVAVLLTGDFITAREKQDAIKRIALYLSLEHLKREKLDEDSAYRNGELYRYYKTEAAKALNVPLSEIADTGDLRDVSSDITKYLKKGKNADRVADIIARYLAGERFGEEVNESINNIIKAKEIKIDIEIPAIKGDYQDRFRPAGRGELTGMSA